MTWAGATPVPRQPTQHLLNIEDSTLPNTAEVGFRVLIVAVLIRSLMLSSMQESLVFDLLSIPYQP
jgi:hypothetical protein